MECTIARNIVRALNPSTAKGVLTMTRNLSATILAAVATLVFACALQLATANTVVWDNSGDGEWNTSDDSWVGATTYADGDTAQFDSSSPSSSIFIGQGGVAQSVAPAQLYMHFYGRDWQFSGGDITAGNILMDWDSTVSFNQTGSLSFAGGTTISHFGAGFYYKPAGGAVHFGTGTIALTPGRFRFEPTAAGSLTNTIVVPAGSTGALNGNANASFSGPVSLGAGGTLWAEGRNIFNHTVTLAGDATLAIPNHFSSASWGQYNGMIDGGGVNSVTVTDGSTESPTDYDFELVGAGGWNVKNFYKKGTNGYLIVPDTATFFSGVKTNGGKVIVQEGRLVPQHNAYDSKNGTYNVTVTHELRAQAYGTRIQADTINVYSDGAVSGVGTLYANNTYVGNSGTTGKLIPGLSIGTLNVNGNLTLGANSMLDYEFGAPTSDLIAVTGNLTLGGTLNVVSGLVLGETYTLFTYTGTATGSFADITGVDVGRKTVTIENGRVAFMAIPEPATLGLLGAAAAGMLLRRRQR